MHKTKLEESSAEAAKAKSAAEENEQLRKIKSSKFTSSLVLVTQGTDFFKAMAAAAAKTVAAAATLQRPTRIHRTTAWDALIFSGFPCS